MGDSANTANSDKPWLWRKGQSGNPNGRPKGIARLLQEKLGDGEELIDVALKILRGELTELRVGAEGAVDAYTPSIRDRVEVLKLLAAYRWGKPAQAVLVAGPDGGPVQVQAAASLPLQGLSDDQLRRILDVVSDGPGVSALIGDGGAGAAPSQAVIEVESARAHSAPGALSDGPEGA